MSDNGDIATLSELGNKIDLAFESLQQKCRERMSRVGYEPNTQMKLKNSITNSSAGFLANLLNKVDLEFHREESSNPSKKKHKSNWQPK